MSQVCLAVHLQNFDMCQFLDLDWVVGLGITAAPFTSSHLFHVFQSGFSARLQNFRPGCKFLLVLCQMLVTDR